MANKSVTTLKKEEPFNTKLNVNSGISIHASTEEPRAGYAANLSQVLQIGVEAAKKSSDYTKSITDGLIDIRKNIDDLTLKENFHYLENELQKVYINNREDAIACDEGWKAVVEKVKKDGSFKGLKSKEEVENFADNIINKYRLQVAENTLRQQNERLHDLSVNELETKQNELQIAFCKIASPDEKIQKDGFIHYCVACDGIKEIASRKNYTGGDVFSLQGKLEIDKASTNILAQSYARVKFERTQNLLDKINFIREIEEGTHKVDLKDFLKIPDDLAEKAEVGNQFGDFDFANVDIKSRAKITKELNSKLTEHTKILKQVNLMNYAAKVADGEYPKMPSNKTYQEAVEAKYDALYDNEITQVFTSRDPKKYGQLLNLNLNFVNTYRYVPKRLTDSIQAVPYNNDPELFNATCLMVDAMLDTSNKEPIVFQDEKFLKEATLPVLGMKLIRNGMPVPLAFEVVRKNLETDEKIKKGREETFKAAIKEKGFTLDDILPKGSFPNSPFYSRAAYPQNSVRELMKQQLLTLTEGFYIKCGDIDAAKKSAAMLLKQKWGVTQINGRKEITAYPIEHYYCNDAVSIDALRGKVARAVEQINKAYKTTYKPVDVELRVDTTTYRNVQEGMAPTYSLYFKNEFDDYDDNVKGDRIRLGEEDFIDKKDKKANGTSYVEEVNKQLDDIQECVDIGKKLTHIKNYAELYTLS